MGVKNFLKNVGNCLKMISSKKIFAPPPKKFFLGPKTFFGGRGQKIFSIFYFLYPNMYGTYHISIEGHFSVELFLIKSYIPVWRIQK